MISLGLALVRLGKGLVRGFADPDFRALLLVLLLTILGGTLFYHEVEGWGWLDAAYRATLLLATITPDGFALTAPISKIFTIVYVIAGVGVMISFAVTLAGHIARPSALREGLKERIRGSDEG